MQDIDLITIEIKGPTQSGKTAILESIREILEREYGLADVHMKTEHRMERPNTLDTAAEHESPNSESSVIALLETNVSR